MTLSRRSFAAQMATAMASAQAPVPVPAPVTSRLVRAAGELRIEIAGQSFQPLAFRSFRPTPSNISQFHAAGVRLMSVLHTGLDCTLDVPYSLFGEVWTGPGQYNFANLDRQMDMFIKHAPDAYFNVMLQLDTRDWYLKLHPDYSNTFRNLVEMAGHPQWRADTARALEDLIRYIESRYGNRVFAYSLFCGSSTEWYTNSQSRRLDAAIRPHPLKQEAFRRHLANPEATLPFPHELYRTSAGVLRHPVQDRAALDYWRFHNETIADAVLYFAAHAKRVLDRRKLLGVFYGYLNTLGGKRLLEEGHLAYEKVWRSPDIDMIFSPARYGQPRRFNGASGYLTTVDSLALHNKLTFQELDHTTYIAPTTVENGRRIPGSDSKLANEFETRMVLRREFALTRVKQTGVWWFDFFGGYYDSDPLRREVANIARVNRRLENIPTHSVAQIAVFGDPSSMYFSSSLSRLSDDLLVNPPDTLARIGAPWDIYNLSDIDNPALPLGQYKVIIFLNPLQMSASIREYISRVVARQGRTLVWIWAPNFIGNDSLSPSGITAVTGIRVSPHDGVDGVVTLPTDSPLPGLSSEASFGFSEPLFPLFRIDDPGASVLGHYRLSKAPAIAIKQFPEHTSIYSAVPNLPAMLYRALALRAGVHIYHSGPHPVYVNSRLLGIHAQGSAATTVHLPSGYAGEIEELFDGRTIPLRGASVDLPAEPGSFKLYLLPQHKQP